MGTLLEKQLMHRHTNYDPVADYYDGLSRIVFGNSIIRSRQFLIQSIFPSSRILIVGGGTGRILEEITSIHAQGLNITYVEKSVRMMSISKKRNLGKHDVTFICQPIEDAKLEGRFDVVITAYLFDNFLPASHDLIFRTIDQYLTNNAVWLFADFTLRKEKLIFKLLLKLMYGFFGTVCQLETRSLSDAAPYFKQYKFTEKAQAVFYRGFIMAVVYQKHVNLLSHHG